MIGENLPANGIQGLWHLNGNSNDSSPNANNGTDTSVTYTIGKFQQGGNLLSASSSRIAVSAPASLKITQNLTVGGWFKSSTTGADQGIFCFRDSVVSPNSGYHLSISSSNNKLYFSRHDNTGTVDGVNYKEMYGDTVVTDGKWHFGTAVYNSVDMRIYLDGFLNCTPVTFNHDIAFSAGATSFIGALSTSTWLFNGALDEIFVANRAFTSKDIKNYYSWATGRYTKIL